MKVRRGKDFEMRGLDEPPRKPSGVAPTLARMHGGWADDAGRKNQARAFVKRAKRSDRRRKIGKSSRKRNRA